MKTIIAIAAATLAVPAIAQEPSAPRASAVAAPAQVGGTAAGERRHCVKDTPTGTRIERKDCRTRTQWLAYGFDPLEAMRK